MKKKFSLTQYDWDLLRPSTFTQVWITVKSELRRAWFHTRALPTRGFSIYYREALVFTPELEVYPVYQGDDLSIGHLVRVLAPECTAPPHLLIARTPVPYKSLKFEQVYHDANSIIVLADKKHKATVLMSPEPVNGADWR